MPLLDVLSTAARPLAAAALCCAFGQTANAQPYPSSTISFVVPYPPGGSPDLVARVLAATLSPKLGQQVVVINRPGGGGQVGIATTINALPDGYTFLVTPNGPITISALATKLPYEPAKDLAPVTLLAIVPAAIAVNASVPAKSLSDFIRDAKERPGQINYGIPSFGTHMHLVGELLKAMTGMQLVAVPYKGNPQSIAALRGGEIQAAVSDLTSLLQVANQGTIRILAVADRKRSTWAPSIPTVAESGVSNFGVSAWIAMFAPIRTASPIIARLNGEVGEAMKSIDVRNNLTNAGVDPAPGTALELDRLVHEQIESFRKIINEANIKFE